MMNSQESFKFNQANQTREQLNSLLDQQNRINLSLRDDLATKMRKLEALNKRLEDMEKVDADTDVICGDVQKISSDLVESINAKQKIIKNLSNKTSFNDSDNL